VVVGVIAIGGVETTGDWLVEVTGLGCSFEHPTAKEQTIRSTVKISVLVVGLKWLLVQSASAEFALPQATEFVVDGAVWNRLIRVMVGHLLLLSSDLVSA
jgi:hypothetical protein